MRGISRSKLSRLARITALGVGALALAGCVAPYDFVQPGVAGSGGYYTSESPYAYDGYYGDSYDAYPVYGYGNGYYVGGYEPSIRFGLGFSNGWGYPDYWGTYGGASCWQWSCGRRRWHGHGHHHDGGHDPVATAPQRWLKPDHPHIPPAHGRQDAPSMAVPERPMDGFATRRRLPSASFAPHDFARMPIRRPMAERAMGMPARPMIRPRRQETTGFTLRALAPMPSGRSSRFSPAPRSAGRPVPVRSDRHANRPSIKRN